MPTPAVAANPDVGAGTLLPTTGVGAWPTCFRPAAVTIHTGEIVQWQAATYEVVRVTLDDGVDLGPVLHVLEVRFNKSGTYASHGNPGSRAGGTITVEGPPQPGPAVEIWSPSGHRVIAALPSRSPSEASASLGPASASSSGQATCAVTKPIPRFVPPKPFLPSPPAYYRSDWFGSAHLWTMINRHGDVWDASALPHNPGGLTQKTFWWVVDWTLANELSPAITVSGTRLDTPGTFSFSPGTNAIADFGAAMLVGVDFPTPGCWQVTGRYRDAVLSYIVWIKE
jgi:hypothetical protein